MTDQLLTERPGTADEPLSTPPGTVEPLKFEVTHTGPGPVPIPGMKLRYKFFQLAVLNAKEELQFNKEFVDEGWAFAGMAAYGPRVVVLGMKLVPVVVDVEDALPEVEKTPPGALDDEVDEKDASKSPVQKTKVVDPFRTSG